MVRNAPLDPKSKQPITAPTEQKIASPWQRQMNRPLQALLASQPFLIMLHRGAHGGNLVENTAAAVNVAVKQGADIVEIDLAQSTDGDFFVFHDGGEPRLLHEQRNLNQLSTASIAKKFYYNWLDQRLTKKVERFSELLAQVPDDVFLNLDRSWDHWPAFLALLDQFPQRHDHFILKSPVRRDLLTRLATHPIKYMYVPIISQAAELTVLESYPEINVVGVEVIEKTATFDLIHSRQLAKYRAAGYLMLGNAINLDDQTQLFGALSDEVAITQAPDQAWGQLLTSGINCIQTDWAGLLDRYRTETFK